MTNFLSSNQFLDLLEVFTSNSVSTACLYVVSDNVLNLPFWQPSATLLQEMVRHVPHTLLLLTFRALIVHLRSVEA